MPIVQDGQVWGIWSMLKPVRCGEGIMQVKMLAWGFNCYKRRCFEVQSWISKSGYKPPKGNTFMCK